MFKSNTAAKKADALQRVNYIKNVLMGQFHISTNGDSKALVKMGLTVVARVIFAMGESRIDPGSDRNKKYLYKTTKALIDLFGPQSSFEGFSTDRNLFDVKAAAIHACRDVINFDLTVALKENLWHDLNAINDRYLNSNYDNYKQDWCNVQRILAKHPFPSDNNQPTKKQSFYVVTGDTRAPNVPDFFDDTVCTNTPLEAIQEASKSYEDSNVIDVVNRINKGELKMFKITPIKVKISLTLDVEEEK